MSKLHISDSLSLPLDAVTQKFAFLGRTGSGKSYGSTKLAELMLAAKAQVVALDPVGVWYGLRIAAGGKGDGFNIPVFGGLHGDLPIEAAAGALIADLVVERNLSAVLDLSGFLLAEQRRFATDFATQLFHRKKQQRSAVHVFFEEAQEFVPQQVRGDVAKMVGAFERLIKLGRNFGIGATLISQRPQAVNKDVLNQTECLVAFQMTGPQERKTIQNWIAEKGLNEDIATVLPHLKVGQAHVWSPQWLQISETITIARKTTADVSSTPDVGAASKVTQQELSPVDVEALREKMAATIERAKAEDPKELRREIAKLKAELQKLTASKPETKVETKEVPVLSSSQEQALQDAVKHLGQSISSLTALAKEFQEPLSRLHSQLAKFGHNKPAGLPINTTQRSSGEQRARHNPVPGPLAAPGGPTAGLKRMMIALAQRPQGLTRSQLGLRSQVSSKGGSFNTYLSRANTNGWIETGNGRIQITDAGLAALGDYTPLPEGRELLQHYLAEFGTNGAGRMLKAVADVYPDSMTRSELGEASGVSPDGGSFNTYLSRLRTLELVTTENHQIRASDEFFEV